MPVPLMYCMGDRNMNNQNTMCKNTFNLLSSITFHYSLFTIHYSLFTFHYSLFTIHYSCLIASMGSIFAAFCAGI